MSDAITMAERKVMSLKAELRELRCERDQVYRGTSWYADAVHTKTQELSLAEAQLWALRKAKENARVMPQSGYRLAYVAQN